MFKLAWMGIKIYCAFHIIAFGGLFLLVFIGACLSDMQ